MTLMANVQCAAVEVHGDRRQVRKLRRLGWCVLTVWECQTRPDKLPRLAERLRRFLTA